ncbi:serine protease [Streptomyces sp. NBC_01317]|uniref:VMAP-C domain-containing protein n=1 Tax=Streptomyces sp. NBC_01317 TaxID=2903822 RepID=UPI002E142BF5|nr:serine protease [Streptomyces sp. NBC_01317]
MRASPAWHARIDVEGAVEGSGFLVTEDTVLTCAHVVGRWPRAEVVFPGARGLGPVAAEVVARGAWAGGDTDPGDLAVLRLDRPVGIAPAVFARLGEPYATPPPKLVAYGFPHGYGEEGVQTELRATSHLLIQDEWAQLEYWRGYGQQADRGFSGAAVMMEASGEVAGMVVSQDAVTRNCRMIPARVLARHWAPLADRVPTHGCRREEKRRLRELVERARVAPGTPGALLREVSGARDFVLPVVEPDTLWAAVWYLLTETEPRPDRLPLADLAVHLVSYVDDETLGDELRAWARSHRGAHDRAPAPEVLSSGGSSPEKVPPEETSSEKVSSATARTGLASAEGTAGVSGTAGTGTGAGGTAGGGPAVPLLGSVEQPPRPALRATLSAPATPSTTPPVTPTVVPPPHVAPDPAPAPPLPFAPSPSWGPEPVPAPSPAPGPAPGPPGGTRHWSPILVEIRRSGADRNALLVEVSAYRHGHRRLVGEQRLAKRDVRAWVLDRIDDAFAELDTAGRELIAFALPRDWLNHPVDQWSARKGTRTPLGCVAPVVVMDHDRRTNPRLQFRLKKMWDVLDGRRESRIHRIACADAPAPGLLAVQLQDVAGPVALTRPPTAPDDRATHRAVLDAPAPIVLWPRTGCPGGGGEACGDACRGKVFLDSLAERLSLLAPGELPEHVFTLRKHAFGHEGPEPHWAADLSFVWDDPRWFPDVPRLTRSPVD